MIGRISEYLFSTGGYSPHGYCLAWDPPVFYTHLISDLAIFVAYLTIPVALFVLVKRRGDMGEYRPVLIMFGLFIFACGLTHLFSAATLWVPVYGLQGVVKAGTGAISLMTAFALWPLLPKLLAVPTPAQMTAKNTELEETIALLRQRDAELKASNEELSAANERLRDLRDSEVRAERERLRDAIEAIPNGFLLWDADGNLMVFNERYREIRPENAEYIKTLPRIEELLYRSVEQRLPEASADEVQAETQRILGLYETGQRSERLRMRDGRWLQLDVRRTAEGGRVAIYTDITEPVRTRNQLVTAIDSMQSGFFLYDSDYRLVLCNEPAQELFPSLEGKLVPGVPLKEVLQITTRARMPDATDEQVAEAADRTYSTYLRGSANYERMLPNGSWRHFAINHTVDNEIVAVVSDITDLKVMQQALEKRAAELRRSNEELEQFAYMASHDLQEPLRVIASYCELIKRRYSDQLDDDGREFVEFAVEGAKRMRSLIDDLLTFSRVGRTAIEFESFSAAEPFGNSIAALQALIEETGASVTFDDAPVLAGDSILLAQVFQNLIANAIKFRSDAPPVIRISAVREKGFWRITVADNGIGIEPKFAERVFRMFQRLHTRDEYAGNGLGLALCQRIVSRHGGRIWVEPSAPPGTKICFTWPETEHQRSIAAQEISNGG